MAQTNRLAKLVKATSKFPKGLRSTLWSKAFGRIVPMVGTANIRYLEVDQHHVKVRLENQRNMQNHIKGLHAAAMGQNRVGMGQDGAKWGQLGAKFG